MERRQGKGAGRGLPQGRRGRTAATIEIWGDGKQTRSFLYIDECLEGTRAADGARTSPGPVNIGSEEMVTHQPAGSMIAGHRRQDRSASGHIPGPTGVRGRNSDNRLIREQLGWAPSEPLRTGSKRTGWIRQQVHARTPAAGFRADAREHLD